MSSTRPSRKDDVPSILRIWQRAVDATHAFLTPEDRLAIGAEVETYLPSVALTVAVNDADRPLAFMALSGSHIDALFVDPASAGKGVGKMLIEHALSSSGTISTDVNAQNEAAVGFYKHLGFVETGTSDVDGQGRNYPLIHLRRDS